MVLTCDPAISEKSSACRSAIVVAAMSPFSKMFVLDYWVGRQGDPAKLIEKILDMAYTWQPRIIGIESVAFQASMEPYTKREMELRNVFYPLIMLKPDRNERKQQRIMSMQPFFRAGQIYIQRGMIELIDEYETFPLGRTCDVLDALAYAVRLLVPQQQSKRPSLDAQLQAMAKQDPSSARYWRADAVKRGILDAQPSLDDLIMEDDVETQFEVGVGDFYS